MFNKVLIILVVGVVLSCYADEKPKPKQKAPSSGGSAVSDAQLEQALSDKRYLSRQLKCAIGEAPCDPVGKRLKSLAPFVLRGSCPRCTPEEQKQIQRTLLYVQKNYPKEWNRLLQSYTG